MDDQYWIKKDWRRCDSRLPLACRRAEDHGRPAEVRLQHGPRASLDHEGALFPSHVRPPISGAAS